jgi:hypothetical protein
VSPLLSKSPARIDFTSPLMPSSWSSLARSSYSDSSPHQRGDTFAPADQEAGLPVHTVVDHRHASGVV